MQPTNNQSQPNPSLDSSCIDPEIQYTLPLEETEVAR